MTLFGDQIFTKRLVLRRIQEEDLANLARWSNSQEAHGPYLSPDKQSLQHFRDQHTAGSLWCDHSKYFIIQHKNGAPLGTIHYWLRNETNSIGVMAIKIACPEERRKGFGTEAQKFLIMFLFQRLRLDAVDMYTDINNVAQQRCLQKLGFEVLDSLSYADHKVHRQGFLYRLHRKSFFEHPIYQHHYE
ncbi:GNAT family N-acetyltransferase [Desulfogranum japonicum]|uniref:GNAT family N-acetyltransferase n=1 Tax=Desulfogranum japonicum TaxID=231447 RepID=UPI0003F7F850|nr:GNAT family N-acetyltransferase [Desulfogranum japonicum]